MFIGKFNRSVIVTYLGTLATMLGFYLALIDKNITGSILCLMVAGICDMFDGKVARMCKNRTDEDKLYGIQIDSLADIVAFVAFPLVIFYAILLKYDININIILILLISTVFVVCGITRLAYFNIAAELTEGPIKYYSGLPVTTTAIIFPLIYLLSFVLSKTVFAYVYLFIILLVALLFVLNFKLKKPRGKTFFILVPIIGLLFSFVLIYLKYRS